MKITSDLLPRLLASTGRLSSPPIRAAEIDVPPVMLGVWSPIVPLPKQAVAVGTTGLRDSFVVSQVATVGPNTANHTDLICGWVAGLWEFWIQGSVIADWNFQVNAWVAPRLNSPGAGSVSELLPLYAIAAVPFAARAINLRAAFTDDGWSIIVFVPTTAAAQNITYTLTVLAHRLN